MIRKVVLHIVLISASVAALWTVQNPSNKVRSVADLTEITQKLLISIDPRVAQHVRIALAVSPEVQAYSTSTGQIVVYSGLIQYYKFREDMVAAVIAHEIAHFILNHSAVVVATRVLSENDSPKIVGSTYWIEEMADRLARTLMADAGYSPCAVRAARAAAIQLRTPSSNQLDDHPNRAQANFAMGTVCSVQNFILGY